MKMAAIETSTIAAKVSGQTRRVHSATTVHVAATSAKPDAAKKGDGGN